MIEEIIRKKMLAQIEKEITDFLETKEATEMIKKAVRLEIKTFLEEGDIESLMNQDTQKKFYAAFP